MESMSAIGSPEGIEAALEELQEQIQGFRAAIDRLTSLEVRLKRLQKEQSESLRKTEAARTKSQQAVQKNLSHTEIQLGQLRQKQQERTQQLEAALQSSEQLLDRLTQNTSSLEDEIRQSVEAMRKELQASLDRHQSATEESITKVSVSVRSRLSNTQSSLTVLDKRLSEADAEVRRELATLQSTQQEKMERMEQSLGRTEKIAWVAVVVGLIAVVAAIFAG